MLHQIILCLADFDVNDILREPLTHNPLMWGCLFIYFLSEKKIKNKIKKVN